MFLALVPFPNYAFHGDVRKPISEHAVIALRKQMLP